MSDSFFFWCFLFLFIWVCNRNFIVFSTNLFIDFSCFESTNWKKNTKISIRDQSPIGIYDLFLKWFYFIIRDCVTVTESVVTLRLCFTNEFVFSFFKWSSISHQTSYKECYCAFQNIGQVSQSLENTRKFY